MRPIAVIQLRVLAYRNAAVQHKKPMANAGFLVAQFAAVYASRAAN
jgi:hypothetical protein